MIVIIPCGAKKQSVPVPAYAMYLGAYYKACLRYALSISKQDDIFILSAKHGLLALDDPIAPYNLRMGEVGSVTTQQIRDQALQRGILNEQVVGIGGRDYTDILCQVWADCITPLQGVGGIGKQIQWLKWHRGVIPQ